MPHDVELAELGQGGRRGREVLIGDERRQRPIGDVRGRQDRREAAGAAGLEEQGRWIEFVHMVMIG